MSDPSERPLSIWKTETESEKRAIRRHLLRFYCTILWIGMLLCVVYTVLREPSGMLRRVELRSGEEWIVTTVSDPPVPIRTLSLHDVREIARDSNSPLFMIPEAVAPAEY